MKTCTKCGEVKPITEFGKHAKTRDGLRACCKTCNSIATAAYVTANKDKVAAKRAAWRAANPDKVRAHKEAYYAANIDKVKAYKAAYYASNAEKVKSRSAAWYEANQDRAKASGTSYYAANADKIKARAAAWYAANPEANRMHHQNRRARKRAAGGKLSSGLADKLFNLQRGKCACGCKRPLGTEYNLDHIMPLALGGSNTDDNIQLLRAKCNNYKRAKHPVDFMQQQGFLL